MHEKSLSTKHTSSYAVSKQKHNENKNRFENIFPCKFIMISTVIYNLQ